MNNISEDNARQSAFYAENDRTIDAGPDDEGMHLHAHVDTASRDCDGPMYREYVLEMNDDEAASEFADLEFKGRVLNGQVSFHSEFGVTVNVTAEGFEVQEQTDEGYRSAGVRWCEDPDCDPRAYSQRDVYAEMMGY